ncbi:MAG: LysR family transcriptional regulator [Lachnospiraceae bacterium]|jgi:molybdate transport system regulatory protein|nr:LysR family transcriptional regulator [Lachnospiraceae bacterium]
MADARFRCIVTVRIATQTKHRGAFFGPGPCELLYRIEELGSTVAAAKKMGISYSKARILIENLERELGYAVVIRKQGGKDNGSSRLTEEGKRFLALYQRLSDGINVLAQGMFAEVFGDYGQVPASTRQDLP